MAATIGWLARVVGRGALGALFCLPAARSLAGVGFDSGENLAAVAARRELGDPWLEQAGRWIRIRDLADPKFSSATLVARQREILAGIHREGFRTCALLMPAAGTWRSGVRPLAGASLPLDLREARDWAARMAECYRGLVDVWEIGNEPDIGFLPENPEHYAAFLKACYWGTGGRVLMAALALPPGPYLERLIGNDALTYTTGFNYHFYGYAEDFSGVHRQFAAAVAAGAREAVAEIGSTAVRPVSRELPVFLTEIGDGMLGTAAGKTVDGRVRQWRWFRDVAQQIETLRLEGAMAFMLPPFQERGLSEFGLVMPPALQASPSAGGGSLRAGGLRFRPEDFGATGPAHWMADLGRRVGDGEASPALAYLIDHAKTHPYESRPWKVRVLPPSAVVLDFLADPETKAVKSVLGYVVSGEGSDHAEGGGSLRIYNFSDHTVAGRLRIAGAVRILPDDSRMGGELRLGAHSLLTAPLRLGGARGRGEEGEWEVAFIPDEAGNGMARISSRFYRGDPDDGPAGLVDSQSLSGPNVAERRRLLGRRRAEGEPILTESGRWLTTEGLAVLERPGSWTFRIDHPPIGELRPAMAELALPDGFRMSLGDVLRLDYRCWSAGTGSSRYAGLSGALGGLMQVQLRTANGNLYEVWPRLTPGAGWQIYQEAMARFTMSFYSRAALPWRFSDNRPAALVFFFWPRTVPTEIEIQPVGFVRAARGAAENRR